MEEVNSIEICESVNTEIPTRDELIEIAFIAEIEAISEDIQFWKSLPIIISSWNEIPSIHERVKSHLQKLGYNVNLSTIPVTRRLKDNVPVTHYEIS